MKQVTFFLCYFFATFSLVQAHIQSSITRYVQWSQNVFIVKAISVDNAVVTFAVEEVIKGTPPSTLKLSIGMVPVAITQGSEWLLASAQSPPLNSVGWAMEGDFGWVNAPIHRVKGKPYLVGHYGYVNPKTTGSGTPNGLSLEDLKKLAATPIEKH